MEFETEVLPDSDEDEKAEEEKWRRLKKWAFRLRYMIQELLLDQITLLIDDLQEAEVRIHRQKELYSMGQNPAAPPPVTQVSGGGTGGGQRGASVSAAAAPTGPATGGVKKVESNRQALQEKWRLQRKLFEMLEDIIKDVDRRPRKQGGDSTTSEAESSGDEPLADYHFTLRRFWARCLQTPRSIPVYKKAYMIPIEEVVAFSHLSEWMAENASFVNELLGAVTHLCCQPDLVEIAMRSLKVNFDDYLNLKFGDSSSSGDEAEKQGNESAAVESKSGAAEATKKETKSEGGQGEGSMIQPLEDAMGSLNLDVHNNINPQDVEGRPPRNGANKP